MRTTRGDLTRLLHDHAHTGLVLYNAAGMLDATSDTHQVLSINPKVTWRRDARVYVALSHRCAGDT